MKRLIVLFVLLFAVPCFAADYTIRWDATAGVTGYRVYQSINSGAWSAGLDVGLVTTKVFTVSDTSETCFRINAYNANGEMGRPDVKVCVDPRKVLPGHVAGQGVQ